MELSISDRKVYGELVTGDVFTLDNHSWQKLKNGRSYCPALNIEIVIGVYTLVDYVGMGIWPSGEGLEGVMSAID